MKILALMLAVFSLSVAQIAASKEEDSAIPKVEYINLQPPFVANFDDGESRSRLSYVKADIALRVSTTTAKTAVEYHAPYLRHELVMLLSKQDMATMTTNEGKERLRAEALEKVKAVLQQEEGQPMVEDLLFSTFVIQR